MKSSFLFLRDSVLSGGGSVAAAKETVGAGGVKVAVYSYFLFSSSEAMFDVLLGKTCSKGLNLLNNCVNKKLTLGGCLPLPRGYIHL